MLGQWSSLVGIASVMMVGSLATMPALPEQVREPGSAVIACVVHVEANDEHHSALKAEAWLIDRSSKDVPAPAEGESCANYWARLMYTGKRNGVMPKAAMQPVAACRDLEPVAGTGGIIPSLGPEAACLHAVIYGWW
jgi:hypothetical protein